MVTSIGLVVAKRPARHQRRLIVECRLCHARPVRNFLMRCCQLVRICPSGPTTAKGSSWEYYTLLGPLGKLTPGPRRLGGSFLTSTVIGATGGSAARSSGGWS
jgi:hypothetical protein